MKQFSNYDEAKKSAQYSGSEQLPLGTYVCKILNVQYQDGKDGNSDIINILFDVAEGDQKDFFKKKYDDDNNEDKKWKGRASIWVPTDDGSEKDGWTKNSFARWTDSIEKSNKGYTWDWEENKWKGKLIGIRFRECGKIIDGKAIKYNEVDRPFDVDFARKNPDSVGKFKAYNGFDESKTASSAPDQSGFLTVNSSGNEEEIPF